MGGPRTFLTFVLIPIPRMTSSSHPPLQAHITILTITVTFNIVVIIPTFFIFIIVVTIIFIITTTTRLDIHSFIHSTDFLSLSTIFEGDRYMQGRNYNGEEAGGEAEAKGLQLQSRRLRKACCGDSR